MKTISKVIISLLICIIVVGGIYVYIVVTGQSEEEVYSTVSVKKQTVEEMIDVEGTVRAVKKEPLFFAGGAEVKEVNVELGDDVSKDDVLIVFEGDVELKAPFDGRIVELNAYDGKKQLPNQNEPLVVVAEMDNLEYVSYVDEDEVEYFEQGQEVRLICDVNDTESVEAEVADVGLTAQKDLEGTVTFKVVSTVTDLNDVYPREGMTCEGDVIIDTIDDALVLPEEAVLFVDDTTYIFLVQDDLIQRAEVQLGIMGDNLFEITDGVNEGDEVIEDASKYSKNETDQ